MTFDWTEFAEGVKLATLIVIGFAACIAFIGVFALTAEKIINRWGWPSGIGFVVGVFALLTGLVAGFVGLP